MFSRYCNEAGDGLERNMHIDALRSSIGKLSGSLRCLSIGDRCLVALVVHGWSNTLSSPRHLRKLDLSSCIFQRIPEWIAQLHNLYSLTLSVGEVADGVSIIAGLPSLAYFQLYTGSSSKREERIIISSRGFGALKHLNLRRPYSSLVFQPGALPRLEKLHILFRYLMSAEFLPVGIEHLPLGILRKIHLTMVSEGDTGASQVGQHKATVVPLLKRAFEQQHPAADITIDMGYYE